MDKLKVTKKDENKRLDIYLTDNINGLTRAYAKRIIESNKVLVNSEIEYRSNYKVKLNDVIIIDINIDKFQKITPTKINLQIIYEDKDIIVINKQSGIPSVPSNNEVNSAMNGIAYIFKQRNEKINPRMIHRLDKNTSGVLIIAKTVEAQRYYANQFANRKIIKKYIALTSGKIHSKYMAELNTGFKVETFVRETGLKEIKMEIVSRYQTGVKQAITNFRLLNRVGEKFLFELTPETGRTHQIRLHCKYIGAPVIGDHMYGGIKYKRLMLHAYKLRAIDPRGKELNLIAKIPVEFENYVQITK